MIKDLVSPTLELYWGFIGISLHLRSWLKRIYDSSCQIRAGPGDFSYVLREHVLASRFGIGIGFSTDDLFFFDLVFVMGKFWTVPLSLFIYVSRG